ncbi:HlyD family secretion protein [Pedobacter endophyticus]|uniref:HlyD family efflux transporter periplasmic adaptor subunit n=1 Tax=Pedobacter endophyticus TaxID=2789740 RepID=A0A7S9KYK5_9SPHI|nr:HlyD family efflux transporter periplasmic adaptor subunit [Pedobacter endophyticus]QPH39222.1 HlyD family efflux transporter periplasmic adaptor subunit [Pedobacter endophyticus]
MPEHEHISIEINSEEIQEIIAAVPDWIIRWGITLVFFVLGGIILLSAFIEYPDIVKVNLKVNSLNAPKAVFSKQSGKLISLLVEDGQKVTKNQLLAFFESTADPNDVLKLSEKLKEIQNDIFNLNNQQVFKLPINLNLGEIQGNYQRFYQEYLQYQSTQKNGYYLSQMAFLERDLSAIKNLKSQILKQRQIQLKEYANSESEYRAYKQLYTKKVISRSEFIQQENKYLAAKYPLQQTETSVLNNTSSYIAKEKELAELRNTITQQQAKFVQALNQCITECEAWTQQHILRAPIAGKVSFAGILQQNQNIASNQEVFIINPGNTDFFGEVQIPQYNMGKIHIGVRTLVKLQSYPFEQYGMIRGKLTYLSDAAYRDSVFIAKVSFDKIENKESMHKIVLKNGMLAEAMIITEESSLLQRFFRNITKMIGNS